MQTISSTADVRPRDRFDSWYATARKYVIDHVKKMSPGEPVHRPGVQWAKDEFDCSRWRAIVNMALLP
jgi:hypothetical protein